MIPSPDALPGMVWEVTETAYGKVIGRRQHRRLAHALATAATWLCQSAGDVTISRREVPA